MDISEFERKTIKSKCVKMADCKIYYNYVCFELEMYLVYLAFYDRKI